MSFPKYPTTNWGNTKVVGYNLLSSKVKFPTLMIIFDINQKVMCRRNISLDESIKRFKLIKLLIIL